MCRKKPPNTTQPPEETQTYSPSPRSNGWLCPWNAYMVSVWFFIFLFAVFYFATLLPFIPAVPRYILCAIGMCLFTTAIVTDIIAISINPIDPNISGLGGKNKVRPIFDRSKHNHVIENLYCNLCQCEVGYKTKHCKTCDKCVSDFDHHCKWLNNCVGDRNYWAFFVCVSTSFFGVVLNFIGCVTLFILFFASRSDLKWWDGMFPCSNGTNTSVCIRLFQAEVPDPVFPVLMGVECLLCVIGMCLLGQLFFFHVYLRIIGMSTFDYLLKKDNVKHEKLVKRHSNNSRASTPIRPNSRQSMKSVHSVKDMKIVRENSQASDNVSQHSNGLDTHPRTPEQCYTPTQLYTHDYAIRIDSENSKIVPRQPEEPIEMQIMADFNQSDEGMGDSEVSSILCTESDHSKSRKNEIILNTSL